MNIETLQDNLFDSREQLLLQLEQISDDALLQPNTIGDWSIAELLTHLSIWESELVTGLMKLKQGKKPVALLKALADRDGYNKHWLAQKQDRELDQIFDDLHGTRNHVEQWLESFTRKELNEPKQFKALAGKPLWRLIAANSYEHELEHLPALKGFVTQWLIEEEEMSQNHIPLISPLSIEVSDTYAE